MPGFINSMGLPGLLSCILINDALSLTTEGCMGIQPEDAEKIMKKAQESGWKRSAIISVSGRFVVELMSTEKLEFPIVEKNNILVDENFLRIIVEESNKKLEKSWEKIEKLGNFF